MNLSSSGIHINIYELKQAFDPEPCETTRIAWNDWLNDCVP